MAAVTSDYTTAAAEEQIQTVGAALTANNIEAIVVDSGEQARARVFELVPEGAEVHSGKSKTLEDIGLFELLHESGRYQSVRARYLGMDRRTQRDEIRRISSSPDFMLGSVQAVTLDGALVVASYSAGQIGPIASGAGRVILVVGSQKIVADLDSALSRINEHVLPYEDERLRAQMGVPTRLAKLLITYAEARPGRTTVILVREPVGV